MRRGKGGLRPRKAKEREAPCEREMRGELGEERKIKGLLFK